VTVFNKESGHVRKAVINMMYIVSNSVISGLAMEHVPQRAYQLLKLGIALLRVVYEEFNSLQADFTTGTTDPEICSPSCHNGQ
jgi:hypothetical protein